MGNSEKVNKNNGDALLKTKDLVELLASKFQIAKAVNAWPQATRSFSEVWRTERDDFRTAKWTESIQSPEFFHNQATKLLALTQHGYCGGSGLSSDKVYGTYRDMKYF